MKIGVNAMSLAKAFYEDFEGNVARLREGGCDYIEAMSSWGADPKVIEFYASLSGVPDGWSKTGTLTRLAGLRKAGMDAFGAFIFDEYLDRDVQEMGQYFKENGFTYAVLSFLHYDGIDDIYGKIENIKRWAAVLKPYGVQIVMHNHEHDVLPIVDKDGAHRPILDVFLNNTTADELMLEVDTGWLLYSDIDPAAFIAEKIDRIMILHLKDICKEFKEVDRDEIFCACGEGAVDFKAALDAVPEDRRESMLYILDQDKSKGDIVEDQIKSIQYIKGL